MKQLREYVPFAIGCVALVLVTAACSRLALKNPVGPPVIVVGSQPLPTGHSVIGLVSAIGGPSQVRADWRTQAPAEQLPHFALFVGNDLATLFDGPPAVEDPPTNTAIVHGVPDDAVLFVGLGIRGTPMDAYVASGPALMVRTGNPIYVDPGAGSGGDGMTPQTALNDVGLAVANVASSGLGGSVWVKGGSIGGASITLYGGVFLTGGFDPEMRLRDRDTQLYPTRISGLVSHSIFNIDPGTGVAVLDGFDLDGIGSATNGVRDEVGVPLEVRSVSIQGCFRGVRLRALSSGPTSHVTLAGVHLFLNRAEGLDLDGPFDLALESSTFDQNTFEGVRLKSLVAPEGGSASLFVRGCDVQRNGRDGLECRMLQSPGGGPTGGHFSVRVEDSDFEQNADRGMILNIDFDLFPVWTADLRVLGCRFRANHSAGLELHLDSTCSCLVERVSSSANGLEGLSAKGTTLPVMGTVSTSAFFANLGAGVGVTAGTAGLVLSHCVLSGNQGGGLTSLSAPASAVSCVEWLQPRTWVNAVPHASPSQDAADPMPFLNAAREYAQVTAFDGSWLTLSTTPLVSRGDTVEISDDGVLRTVTAIAANQLQLDPTPQSVVIPASMGFFGQARSVSEDWRLSPGSIAIGAGMSSPGAPPRDAGPFGALHAGPPGQLDALPPAQFFVGTIAPSWIAPLAPDAMLVLSFVGGEPDSSLVPMEVTAVDARGALLPITAFAENGQVKISPPPLGWSSGSIVEVHAGLHSTAGVPLSAPVSFPLTVP